MFVYEKKLEYPVRIKKRQPPLAKFICSQYGGPDGELVHPCAISVSAMPCRTRSCRRYSPTSVRKRLKWSLGAQSLCKSDKNFRHGSFFSSKARKNVKGLTTAEFCITITP